MGTTLACPCTGREPGQSGLNTQNDKIKVHDIVSKIMVGRLAPNNILFEYSYENTKICLIKSEQIGEFCNNRKLFKFSENEEIYHYYNRFYVSNFLSKTDTAMIILQSSTSNDSNSLGKNNRCLVSGFYKIEDYLGSEENNYTDQLAKTINLQTMKNYIFKGIVNSESSIKLVFQRNMFQNLDVEYYITTYEGPLDEEKIRNTLDDEKVKNKLLKAIIPEFYPTKEIGINNKQISNKNLYTPSPGKKYYFIFEENKKESIDVDYLIIKMGKTKSGCDCLLQDLASKLNDVLYYYKLSSIISEEKIGIKGGASIYVILSSETAIINNTDLEDN